MENTDRPREVVIHQSANRPNQIMGGDRGVVLVTILITVALGFSLASLWGVLLAGAWHVTAMAVLKRMGKADPLLRQSYMRHIPYRAFYSAKSGVHSCCLQTPMRWM